MMLDLLEVLLDSKTLADAEPGLIVLAGGSDYRPWAWGVFDGFQGREVSYVPFSPSEARKKRLEKMYDEGYLEGSRLKAGADGK
jgi:hypothetical protein